VNARHFASLAARGAGAKRGDSGLPGGGMNAKRGTAGLPGGGVSARREQLDLRYLEVSQLTKVFPGPEGPVVVVRQFDLAIKKGEFVSLIGHSGCGKSTVLAIAAGLVEPTEGGVLVDGREISGPGPELGVVFQAACLLPWMTAFENVMLGVAQRYPQRTHAQRAAIVTEHLERVGLGDALHKKPIELSAGMRQRVGIARAFALDPKVLLLDEPFGMLDSLTRFELQQVLIDTWTQTRKTALMVTHDVDEALFLSDRIAMMTSGPAARLGGILEVPFARPRDRTRVIEHPDYYPLRERLIQFLEDEAHPRAVALDAA
jgi:nitrate/nitrite transport system ATP-binding protein